MITDKLTQKSQEALQEAHSAALRHGHSAADVEHLLLALLQQEQGILPRILGRMEVDVRELKAGLETALEKLPRVSGPGAEIHFSRRLQEVLARAEEEARQLKDEFVSVEHLVLAAIGESERTPVGRLLGERGITRDRFLAPLMAVRGNQRVTSTTPEEGYGALEKYGVDLVAQARAGKLDPGQRRLRISASRCREAKACSQATRRCRGRWAIRAPARRSRAPVFCPRT